MRVRASALAGTWYPGGSIELRELVQSLLAAWPSRPSPGVGVIVPHAGYRYSGRVAGAGYARLRGAAVDRVVLLAPSHRHGFRGAVTLDVDAFETPLGRVAVDRIEDLVRSHPLLRADPLPFEEEHSLEIQLPFLQCALPEARTVPLLFGVLHERDYGPVAELLDELRGPRTIFVVSSDFTHFGWRFGYEPFRAESAEQTRSELYHLDMGAIEPVLRGDRTAFGEYLMRTGATVCGSTPIMAFLGWGGAALRGELLAYETSLDVTGEYDHTVSYAAIAFDGDR
jgi:AmmeMemoRadiSam system protein B